MILFVGRIEPLKGIETLIRALAFIQSTGQLVEIPHYLAIIGGDPGAINENTDSEMARLQKLCRDLGLDNMVLFMGKRGQDTLPYCPLRNAPR